MPSRQIHFGAINVVMPAPHSPERYVHLFERVAVTERIVKIRGDWVGRLGTIRIEKDASGSQVVVGDFYKYIELDATRDWFNVLKGAPAEDGEIKSINIPQHLKPHFQFVPFLFFPQVHRLVMVTKDGSDAISAYQARTILNRAFSDPEIFDQFGKMELTVEPQRDALDKILNLPRLRSLDIVVTPPNPDDFAQYERELFSNMEQQHAGNYRIQMQEVDGKGLAPNNATRNLAKVAQSNGSVSGVGGERGKTVRLSTTDHPFEDRSTYNPETQTRSSVLIARAQSILRAIKG